MNESPSPQSVREDADRILQSARAAIARLSVQFSATFDEVLAAQRALEEAVQSDVQTPMDRTRWANAREDLGRTLGCEALVMTIATLRHMRSMETDHAAELHYKIGEALRSQSDSYPPQWLDAAKRVERQAKGEGASS